MELLLELLATFLLMPALAFAGLVLEIVAAITGILFELGCLLFKRPSLLRSPAAAWKASPAGIRRVRLVLFSFLALSSLALVLFNTILFEPTLRWGLARARARTGIDIRFESASGNWLTGRAELRRMTVRRAADARSNFDLTVDRAAVDLRMTSLLRHSVSLESVELREVRGTVERVAPRGSHGYGRDFSIDRLLVEDASVRFVDRPAGEKPAEMTLALTSLECAPFVRRWAVFDVLFRSNTTGAIDGSPFTIRSDGGPTARRTLWHGENLPLRFFADYAGGGLAWFRSGRADVDVVDAWKDDDAREIDSAWKMRLKSPVAEVPAGLTGWRRPISEAVAAFVNRHPAELPLEFSLKINRDEFDGAVSVESSGLFAAVAHAMTQRLAELAGVPKETIRDYAVRGLEAFKDYLQRWRKKK